MQWRRTEYRGKEKKTKVRGLIEKTQNTNKKKERKKTINRENVEELWICKKKT